MQNIEKYIKQKISEIYQKNEIDNFTTDLNDVIDIYYFAISNLNEVDKVTITNTLLSVILYPILIDIELKQKIEIDVYSAILNNDITCNIKYRNKKTFKDYFFDLASRSGSKNIIQAILNSNKKFEFLQQNMSNIINNDMIDNQMKINIFMDYMNSNKVDIFEKIANMDIIKGFNEIDNIYNKCHNLELKIELLHSITDFLETLTEIIDIKYKKNIYLNNEKKDGIHLIIEISANNKISFEIDRKTKDVYVFGYKKEKSKYIGVRQTYNILNNEIIKEKILDIIIEHIPGNKKIELNEQSTRVDKVNCVLSYAKIANSIFKK